MEQDRYEGIPVTRLYRRVADVPFVRNVLKNEHLWRVLARHLEARQRAEPADVWHAQHVMTTVAAVRAGAGAGTPVVATVRDYWPVCYWSDLIRDPGDSTLCPACTVANMRECVRHRPGSPGRAAAALIPYMRANLRRKQRGLTRADAVIGVSRTITADLLARVPALDPSRIVTIPNPVDMTALAPVPRSDTEPFVLYAGKLAVNKGAQFLLPALDAAGIRWPLVVAGDGPLRATLETEAAARGREVRWLGWRDRNDVLDLMRRAALLAFPSHGPESLSRVLIESAALGLPVAAMDTGGTRDIVVHGETGLLSTSPDAFAADLAALAADPLLRARLGAGAARHARAQFEAAAVAARVEAVYHQVCRPREARP